METQDESTRGNQQTQPNSNWGAVKVIKQQIIGCHVAQPHNPTYFTNFSHYKQHNISVVSVNLYKIVWKMVGIFLKHD